MDSPLSMPGSFFQSDHDNPTRPILTRTTVTSVFRPPQSPHAAPSLSESIQAISRNSCSAHSSSRKRQRLNTLATAQENTEDVAVDSFPFASPSPLVNTKYRLAGGLDTPSAKYEQETDEEQYWRGNRLVQRMSNPDTRDYFPPCSALLQRDGNGRKRAHSTPTRPGWGRTILSLPVGIADRVYQFCTNAFQGFSAGRGQTFQLGGTTPSVVESFGWVKVENPFDVFDEEYRGSTLVPGEFPQESFIENYMSQPQAYQVVPATPTPSHGADGDLVLRNSWAVINKPKTQSRGTSPVRKRPKFGAENRRPNLSGPSSLGPDFSPSRSSASSNASFASPRGGLLRPSSSGRQPNTSSSSPQKHYRSRSSIASPRGLHLSPQDSEGRPSTPVSPELKQFQKRAQRLDKKNKESLRRLTRQTEDLLRMGREALGASVEVQDGRGEPFEEDEGYGPSEGSMDEWR